MKDNLLMTAMVHLDDAYIAEASPFHASPMKRLRRRLVMKWTSVAAGVCAVFLLGMHTVMPYLTTPKPPVYHNALYTADEIGGMFSPAKYGSTSSYTKVYVPDAKYLDIPEIPDDEYISIYNEDETGKALDQQEFTAFADQMLCGVSSALGISPLDYTVKQRETNSAHLEAVFNFEEEREAGYSFYLTQYGPYHTFSVYRNSSSDGRISLHGVPIEIDQTKEDDAIIASLGEMKATLFKTFNVSFEDVRIVRQYGESMEHGVEFLNIYFYNAADNPLNEYWRRPLSDNICLSFDNYPNHKDDVASDTALSNVDISYRQYRSHDTYTPSKQVRMISLEEAECLLYNGYVFGGHSCPNCMAMQFKVNFRNYDFVGLTYVLPNSMNQPFSEVIPFYVFYKKIGKAPNGNLVYAETYVPAIEVKGYEAYFEKQKSAHD